MRTVDSGAPTVGVVTVTYNSDRYFEAYLRALQAQTLPPTKVVVVDSGSPDAAFLQRADDFDLETDVVIETNVGFAAGSNVGWRRVRTMDYVLFLNPDAFPPPEFLQQATAYMDAHPDVGMVTPTLLRFDMQAMQPLDMVDTTGVVRGRLGLLAERDGGAPRATLQKYTGPNDVPWLCAAVALARREAMEAVVEHDAQIFDESFFMYKEDTDLAWRVRRAGWRLVHLPALVGYHCRGWQQRSTMSRALRLMTARNEVKMCVKNRSPFVLVGVAKYLLVLLFNL